MAEANWALKHAK